MLGTKEFRVKVAFGNYRVGDLIWPTGAWRSHLQSSGYIEPVPVEAQAEFATEVQTTEPPRETAVRRRRNTAWDR
jgi:hypothetical protein